MGDERTRPLPIQPAAGRAPASSPEPDQLLEAAIDAGLTGELPWWRVADILDHLVQVDWLRERGHVPEPPAAPMPAVRIPELEAQAAAIRAQWEARSARIRAGERPEPPGGWSAEERAALGDLEAHFAELEAEAC